MMDKRQVFSSDIELLGLITSILNEKQRASLLVDHEGLTRVEGLITSVIQDKDTKNTSVLIDNRETIVLKDIIGVNGLFRSDYSEC